MYYFSEILYCLCQEPERPGMIGCDYCDEWFHPDCLHFSKNKVKEISKIQWKCPKCESNEGIKSVVLLHSFSKLAVHQNNLHFYKEFHTFCLKTIIQNLALLTVVCDFICRKCPLEPIRSQ